MWPTSLATTPSTAVSPGSSCCSCTSSSRRRFCCWELSSTRRSTTKPSRTKVPRREQRRTIWKLSESLFSHHAVEELRSHVSSTLAFLVRRTSENTVSETVWKIAKGVSAVLLAAKEMADRDSFDPSWPLSEPRFGTHPDFPNSFSAHSGG